MTTKRTDVERDLEAQATDEQRQRSGSTPTEDVVERALDVEPGVEQHAGEDAGQVPAMDEDLDELGAHRRMDEIDEREAAERGDPT